MKTMKRARVVLVLFVATLAGCDILPATQSNYEWEAEPVGECLAQVTMEGDIFWLYAPAGALVVVNFDVMTLHDKHAFRFDDYQSENRIQLSHLTFPARPPHVDSCKLFPLRVDPRPSP